MRLARWRDEAGVGGDGFLNEERAFVFPDGLRIAQVLALPDGSVRELHARALEAPGVPLEEITLRAPLDPPSIRDFVAFEEHVEGVSAAIDGVSDVPAEWYEAPTFYFANPHTVLGPLDVVQPPPTDRLDFELEVAVIVGGIGGSNLTLAQAGDAIFGYTMMNDWSARDLQGREMKVRLGPAKGKDFATTLGPWIVTKDELAAFADADGFLALRAEVSVNDRLVGHDLVSNMGWTFAALIAYASLNSRVVAGDVLGSGTVGNGGCLAELWGRSMANAPGPLRTGDVIRMHVEGIGTLRMEVGEAVHGPAVPTARRPSRERERRGTSA